MFHSTRGNKLVSSPEAILNGLADDGGLYVIDQIPSLDYHDLLNDDYQTIAAKVLNKFFPEFFFFFFRIFFSLFFHWFFCLN